MGLQHDKCSSHAGNGIIRMNRQLRILLTGLLVVVPFAFTVWVIWKAGALLDEVGTSMLLRPVWSLLDLHEKWPLHSVRGIGVVILVVGVYLVGLLMHFWLFRKLVDLAEGILERVPGVKTIYESVRDLMKLFNPHAQSKMGQVVEYRPPGSHAGLLGILTNKQPDGSGGADNAAVYFPLAYMIGGPVLFVPQKHLRTVDMPVEKALRLCATAYVTAERDLSPADNKDTAIPT